MKQPPALKSVLISLLFLHFLIHCNTVSLAQDIKGSYWQIIKKDSSQMSVKHLDMVMNDTLFISLNGLTRKVPVDSILSITKVTKGTLKRGLIIGGGIGFFAGGIFGYASNPEGEFVSVELSILGGAVLGVIPGLLIGGGIGAAGSKDKYNDLSKMSVSEKSKVINKHCVNQDYGLYTSTP